MASDKLLETLKGKQSEQGLSLRQLASDIGVTQPLDSMLFAGKRPLTTGTRRKIQEYLRAKPSATLEATLDSFAQKDTHRSLRTLENLIERLTPFVDYLAHRGVHDPLDINREHVEGFLRQIAKGRRGKPLSSGTSAHRAICAPTRKAFSLTRHSGKQHL